MRASKAGVCQGLGLCGFKNLVIKGACLSRIESIVELLLLSYSCSDVGGCRIRSDEWRSLLNSTILMFFLCA